MIVNTIPYRTFTKSKSPAANGASREIDTLYWNCKDKVIARQMQYPPLISLEIRCLWGDTKVSPNPHHTMQPEIKTFPFGEGAIPSNLSVIDRNGEPWFIAGDVCEILGLGHVTNAINPLDDDEKLTVMILRSGQMRLTRLINESGLYALIIRSNKPNAKAFRKWVTGTVLPSIRKTGSFTVAPAAAVTNFVQRFNDNYMQVSPGHFSVISELFIILHGRFEKAGYQIPDKALTGTDIRPDVSVGKCFAAYLDKNLPMAKNWHKPYYHKFPNGTEFPARQYEDALLAEYRKYVLFEWIPKHAERYFADKDKRALDFLPFLLTGEEKKRIANDNDN